MGHYILSWLTRPKATVLLVLRLIVHDFEKIQPEVGNKFETWNVRQKSPASMSAGRFHAIRLALYRYFTSFSFPFFMAYRPNNGPCHCLSISIRSEY